MEPMNGNLGGNPKDKLERNRAGGSLTEILMVSQNFINVRVKGLLQQYRSLLLVYSPDCSRIQPND